MDRSDLVGSALADALSNIATLQSASVERFPHEASAGTLAGGLFASRGLPPARAPAALKSDRAVERRDNPEPRPPRRLGVSGGRTSSSASAHAKQRSRTTALQ